MITTQCNHINFNQTLIKQQWKMYSNHPDTAPFKWYLWWNETLTKLWYGWLLKNDPILVWPTSVRLVNYASDTGIPREKYNGRVYMPPTYEGRIQQAPPQPSQPLKSPSSIWRLMRSVVCPRLSLLIWRACFSSAQHLPVYILPYNVSGI